MKRMLIQSVPNLKNDVVEYRVKIMQKVTFKRNFALKLSAVTVMVALSLQHAEATENSFQKIHSKHGVLYFEDGKEVNLFGFNFQSCLSWEHGARMHNQGILMPLKSRDLRRVTDESLEEIKKLGAELIRIHLMPADFTDCNGNLIDTIWLDHFMYVMKEASNRGLYVYLTLLNHLNHDGTQFPYNPSSFAADIKRENWMFDESAINASKNYFRGLLNMKNPYNGLRLKEHPNLAVIEPINEPKYLDYKKWAQLNNNNCYEAYEEAAYKKTLSYINQVVHLLREEGLSQPIVWNCGWAKLIKDNKASYRGIADSDADAISFCLYPGQSDLRSPFWENTVDLSERNYLPYIQKCAENEDWLGWLKTDLFKDKAKLVYEYETFCNQSGYLYPAMAEFYRSVNVQIAAQWTYGLTSYAEYLGGSHVFNLKTTPKKAASFMVAKQQFKDVDTTYSYESNSSAVFNEGSLIYSGNIDIEVSENPEVIIGLGNSAYINYEGSGIYFIEQVENNAIHLEILPDAEFIKPHWKELHTGEQVVALDYESSNLFKFKYLDEGKYWIYRREANKWNLIEELEGLVIFEAIPGEYLIEREALNIHRKVLEEGWGH